VVYVEIDLVRLRDKGGVEYIPVQVFETNGVVRSSIDNIVLDLSTTRSDCSFTVFIRTLSSRQRLIKDCKTVVAFAPLADSG
jgi:hypothetical protein